MSTNNSESKISTQLRQLKLFWPVEDTTIHIVYDFVLFLGFLKWSNKTN